MCFKFELSIIISSWYIEVYGIGHTASGQAATFNNIKKKVFYRVL